jgi:hypothetical protein
METFDEQFNRFVKLLRAQNTLVEAIETAFRAPSCTSASRRGWAELELAKRRVKRYTRKDDIWRD